MDVAGKSPRFPGDYTRLVPFPLSFGPHRWKVVAVKAGNSI